MTKCYLITTAIMALVATPVLAAVNPPAEGPKPTRPGTSAPAKPEASKPTKPRTGGRNATRPNQNTNSSAAGASAESIASSLANSSSSAHQTQAQRQSQTLDSSNRVSVEGDTYRYPVNSALAGTATTNAECGETAGAAVQTKLFGLSFGGGAVSKDCKRVRLHNMMMAKSAAYYRAGDMKMAATFNQAAMNALCQDRETYQILAASGIACLPPGRKK